MAARPDGGTGMKKLWLALASVLAVSIGMALAEGKDGKTNTDCKAGTASCCCCAKSCPK